MCNGSGAAVRSARHSISLLCLQRTFDPVHWLALTWPSRLWGIITSLILRQNGEENKTWLASCNVLLLSSHYPACSSVAIMPVQAYKAWPALRSFIDHIKQQLIQVERRLAENSVKLWAWQDVKVSFGNGPRKSYPWTCSTVLHTRASPGNARRLWGACSTDQSGVWWILKVKDHSGHDAGRCSVPTSPAKYRVDGWNNHCAKLPMVTITPVCLLHKPSVVRIRIINPSYRVVTFRPTCNATTQHRMLSISLGSKNLWPHASCYAGQKWG